MLRGSGATQLRRIVRVLDELTLRRHAGLVSSYKTPKPFSKMFDAGFERLCRRDFDTRCGLSMCTDGDGSRCCAAQGTGGSNIWFMLCGVGKEHYSQQQFQFFVVSLFHSLAAVS